MLGTEQNGKAGNQAERFETEGRKKDRNRTEKIGT